MSKKDEDEIKRSYKEAGVDLEELEDEEDEEEEDEDEDQDDESEDDSEEDDESEDEDEEDDSDEEEDEDSEDDDDEDSKEEDDSDKKSKKKPSIYDNYKKKKKESRAKDVEISGLKERITELETSFSKAKTPEEKNDALDELDEFAKSINADPATLKKMRELFVKGQVVDDSIKKDLSQIKEFQKKHEKEIAAVAFQNDFQTNREFLQEVFPTMSKKDAALIKTELEKLAHSKDWNDKPLDFIIFKNKAKLSKLISPKKKGLESRERHEDSELEDEFDPEADLTEMSPSERTKWEKKYNKVMRKSQGLSKGSNGKKILI